MLQVKAVGTPEAAQVRLPSPGVYVGQFKDGRLCGRGVVVMKGAGYFGTFSDNMFKREINRLRTVPARAQSPND